MKSLLHGPGVQSQSVFLSLQMGRGRDSDDEDDEDEPQERERSASFAGSRTLELLGQLRNSKHAGRAKALKKFQDYLQKYRPEFYDDDVELLLVVRRH